MSIKYSLLDSFEWLGEFWLEGDKDNSFPGVLTYSPNEGLLLSVVRKASIPAQTDCVIIHGYTQDTGRITLLECLSRRVRVSNLVTQEETLFCRTALIGGHFNDEDKFGGCVFSVNNLAEFCYPQGFRLYDDFKTASVLESDLGSCCLSLYKTASGTFVGNKRLSSLLLLDESHADFREELDQAFERLVEKHDVKEVFAKSEVGYEWLLEQRGKKYFRPFDAIRNVYSIANLCCVLMLKTVRPTRLSLLSVPDGEEGPSSPVLLSLRLTERQVASV